MTHWKSHAGPPTRCGSASPRSSARAARLLQFVGLAWFFESQATTTVIFVRHAEKAALPADDPGLSEAGKLRAAELARQLVDADVVAGVDAIYSTSFRRTEETVLPVATALDLPITSYDASNTETIMDEIVRVTRRTPPGRSPSTAVGARRAVRPGRRRRQRVG